MVDNRTDRHTVTFNLDTQETPKRIDTKDKQSSKDTAVPSRTERFCKLTAVFIVLIAFIVHLGRVLNSGEKNLFSFRIHPLFSVLSGF